MTDQQKVLQFLQYTKSATRNEIAGGTSLSREAADAALALAVASGEIRKSGEANVAVYTLARQASTVSAPEPVDSRTADQKWSDEQRARALAEWRRDHPEETPAPPKRYEPSEQEIAEEMARRKAVTPLTEAERRELEIMTKNRTPMNPQSAIVK